MPLQRLPLFQSNRPIEVIHHWLQNNQLLIDPPYQRGVVWGETRQRNLIRSLLLGIPIPSIVINDRMTAEWPGDYCYAVIDGKQRITAIHRFLQGKFSIPGEWLGDPRENVTFPEMTQVQQRHIKNIPTAFAEGQLKSIEAEQQVFELINFGGVAQGESDPIPADDT